MISYEKLKRLNQLPKDINKLDDEKLNFIINEYSSYKSLEELDIYFEKSTSNIMPYMETIRPVVKCLFELNEILDNDDKINYYNMLIEEQKENIITSYNYFKYNDKAIWNLFCRYGKTMLSAIFAYIMGFRRILILVPSLYLVEQTYNEWKKYFSDDDILQISCENKYKDYLEEHVKKQNYIIICVYNSSGIVENIEFDFGIFDEAHRTAKFTINDNETYYQLLLKSSNIMKRLFLTATIKEYNEDTEYTMDNIRIYGPIICTVTAYNAKEIGRLSDYKLLCILIKDSIDNSDQIIIDNCYENLIKTFDKSSEKITRNFLMEYLKIAKSLHETIIEYDIKHTITYHQTINRCKIFSWLYNLIAKSKNISNYIEGTNNKKERIKLIDKFIKKNNSILSSCKTLQEGVNIPECDATCFIDVKTSIIDTIQSASRCLTKIDNKKIAYIILPFFGDNEQQLKDDNRTNNLRLIIKNLIEVDKNLKEAFDYINFNKYTFIDGKQINTNNNDIIINPIVNFNSLIIEQLRTISYDTYTQATDQIKEKYKSIEEYKTNINNDFLNIPINPDIIYKRTGWKGWQIYLNSSDELLELKYKIKETFKKIDLNGPIDIYDYIDTSNTDINIYKLLNYKFRTYVYFEQFIEKYMIKSYNEYKKHFNIDNNFPYCPYEYYREFGFNESKWYTQKKKKLII